MSPKFAVALQGFNALEMYPYTLADRTLPCRQDNPRYSFLLAADKNPSYFKHLMRSNAVRTVTATEVGLHVPVVVLLLGEYFRNHLCDRRTSCKNSYGLRNISGPFCGRPHKNKVEGTCLERFVDVSVLGALFAGNWGAGGVWGLSEHVCAVPHARGTGAGEAGGDGAGDGRRDAERCGRITVVCPRIWCCSDGG